MKKLTLISIYFILLNSLFAKDIPNDFLEIFKPGDHCVSYVSYKKVFILNDTKIIGKNCSAQASLSSKKLTHYQVKVNIPIIMFDSDNPNRDKNVAMLLNISKKPNMVFTSKPISSQFLKTILKQENKYFDIEGTIATAMGDIPVSSKVSVSFQGGNYVFYGKIRSTYEAFKIIIPSFGPSRFLMHAEEFFDIYFQFQSTKIDNFEKLK